MRRITEIPGPTRKAPPKQHLPSETNEIQGKNSNNKILLTTMKESHPTPPKNNIHSDYDDNYSSSEDEDFDIGEWIVIEPLNVSVLIHFFPSK